MRWISQLPRAAPGRLIWILAGLVVAPVLGVALDFRRLRRLIVDQARRWWPDVRAALSALRASHKMALLVFGSLGTGAALRGSRSGSSPAAFGYDILASGLLVIDVSVSLLRKLRARAGGRRRCRVRPHPGPHRCRDGSPESAIAAVLLYRISTFYLPPLWGFFAMQWLQRNRYL